MGHSIRQWRQAAAYPPALHRRRHCHPLGL